MVDLNVTITVASRIENTTAGPGTHHAVFPHSAVAKKANGIFGLETLYAIRDAHQQENQLVIDLIRRSIDRFRLRYSLDVHPSSFTTTSELSMGRSRQSTDCGAEYSVRPWRRSTKGYNNSIDATTELNTLTNVSKADTESNSMETSLIIH
ncbi:hypothetical protein AVEN_15466-1 [Araneus ventricosus]|uniref:Uncharacterized protein n=1 Tax=Araneus ventricosus TaxID=182803 RepID=A0A4Y2EC12_ARAVE|nr:hypothetical protein AVEN_15466-1 [Araneus ventricosus]